MMNNAQVEINWNHDRGNDDNDGGEYDNYHADGILVW